MRTNWPSLTVTGLLASLAGGCLLPSDRSADFRLAFDSLPPVFVGDTLQLRVHAVDSAAALAVRQGDFLLQSDDPSVLAVTPSGTAVAAAEGTAHLSVRLRYADAPPAEYAVTVIDSLRIDSVVATTSLLYAGDTVAVYGVGLNPATTAFAIGRFPASVAGFQPLTAGAVGGRSAVRLQVPLAATPARVTATRGQRSAAGPATLALVQHDRLEPNDAAPVSLGTLDSVIRRDWLQLEGTAAGGTTARDWYTFENPAAGPVTLILRPHDLGPVSELRLSVTDSLDVAGNPMPQGWMRAADGSYCRGYTAGGFSSALDSQMIAFHELGSGTYHVMVGTSQPSSNPRGYSLRIERAFRATYHPVVPTRYTPLFGADREILTADDILPAAGNCAQAVQPLEYGTSALSWGLTALENRGDVAWFNLCTRYSRCLFDNSSARLIQFRFTYPDRGALINARFVMLRGDGTFVTSGEGNSYFCVPPAPAYLAVYSEDGAATGAFEIAGNVGALCTPNSPPRSGP